MQNFDATSRAQLTASAANEPPPLEQVRPGLWAVGLPFGTGHVPYTLSYLLEDARGGLHVVDPGPPSEANWQTLTEAMAATGHRFTDVRSILVTHVHFDHLGLADRLAGATGAPVLMHALDRTALQHARDGRPRRLLEQNVVRWGVPEMRRAEIVASIRDPHPLDDGVSNIDLVGSEQLDVPGRRVRVLHTPGHTPGHVAFHLEDEKILFTGDHVLPTVFPAVGLGGPAERNPLREYLDSLALVRAFQGHEVLPGHGYRFTGLAERCRAIEAHQRRRAGEAAQLTRSHPEWSVWQIAAHLHWSRNWDDFSGSLLRNALTQTSIYADFSERIQNN